jgi:squalene-hopene/tetraprenyl-beta-curcumene cyclase
LIAAPAPRTAPQAALALERGLQRLLELQHADGYWKGELETNVTIDAEDLFLRHYLGLLEPVQTAATAHWIVSKQRGDGSWATFHGGPADLSTTVEAYVALRLAGHDPGAPHMRAAAGVARDLGGVGRTRVFTRMWLALLGLERWDDVPALPPEQMFLPARAPLSIYSFACWARQTLVALQVATALQPVRPVTFAIDELATDPAPRGPALDRLLHAYGRRPLRRVRAAGLRRAVRWIVERQEADGSWGGIQPPWVWSIVALGALGYPVEHPMIVRALRGLDDFTIEDELGRRIEACQSPVWDTALAVIALLDAGLGPGHPAVASGAEWLVGREVRVRGDWSVRRPSVAPGGFPFEFANDNYPDVDDSAEVVLALRRAGVGGDAADRAVDWVLGMQSKGGGWAAFDVDNTSALPGKLPFCDFGEVTDPPSVDVTAHVLEMLALEGRAGSAAARRGIDYVLREQTTEGSWFGRWGANHVYGTGAAVPALVACGLGRHESVARAIRWLERAQNDDGGFGEDLRSYRDDAWRGRGASTASQTAWALLALHAVGETGPVTQRALEWLADTQRADGSWDEPYHPGTGFPGDFYVNYHLYRQVFPVSALGRLAGGGVETG